MPEHSAENPVMPEIVKTVRAEKRGKNLLKMEVGRTDEGIIVTLQSDVQWAGALREKRYKDPQYNVGGVPCFASKGISLEENPALFNQPDHMAYNGAPNLTMLMAKGLQSGVKFTFQQPMSADKLREWAKQVRAAATEVFNCYLRPVDIQMTITVKENESQTLG